MSIDLGDERVMPEKVDCIESLSTPFVIALDVIAPLEVDIHPHLGKPARLKILDAGKVLRYFHGFVTSSEYRRESEAGHHYRLTLRPWTYFLSQNRDYAIYQEIDAVEIIKKVLDEAGISDADFSKLSKSRKKRTYTVQYGESDFAFISRLMEEEGIYYFFEHKADRHVMVLCESPGCHTPGTPATLTYKPSSASITSVDSHTMQRSGPDHLQSWVERVSTTTEAKVTMRDWDFEKPSRPLNAETNAPKDHPNDQQEVYTYPGKYVEESHGGELGKVVLDGLRANRRLFAGESQAVGLSVGSKVKVVDHPVGRMNATYVIVSAHHSIIPESYRTNPGHTDIDKDEVRFEAIPADTPFHAPLTTPRPVVRGLESAVVTGPEGETIYTDEYCRVKVRFHWDREGRPGEQTTCWIRVSQTGGLGNQIIPRVGHEVLIDFLGGDPDRPIVVGRVFNADHMPIYDLPANKTRALWRTKTYGDSQPYSDAKQIDAKRLGVNELRFEDKAGHEEIFIHAEKDMNERVHYDHSKEVGRDRKFYVGRDETRKIDNNQFLEVTNNQDRKIGASRVTKITQSDDIDIGTTRKLSAGQTIDYKANQAMTIKVGQSSITVDQTGITIKGMMIKIEGTVMTEMKGVMTKVDASAMLQMKGGITMIN